MPAELAVAISYNSELRRKHIHGVWVHMLLYVGHTLGPQLEASVTISSKRVRCHIIFIGDVPATCIGEVIFAMYTKAAYSLLP
jgi:hypothetical protein